MDALDEVLAELAARDHEDEVRGEGYEMARDEITAILEGKGSQLAKLAKIRAWAACRE